MIKSNWNKYHSDRANMVTGLWRIEHYLVGRNCHISEGHFQRSSTQYILAKLHEPTEYMNCCFRNELSFYHPVIMLLLFWSHWEQRFWMLLLVIILHVLQATSHQPLTIVPTWSLPVLETQFSFRWWPMIPMVMLLASPSYRTLKEQQSIKVKRSRQ